MTSPRPHGHYSRFHFGIMTIHVARFRMKIIQNLWYCSVYNSFTKNSSLSRAHLVSEGVIIQNFERYGLKLCPYVSIALTSLKHLINSHNFEKTVNA